MVQHKCNIGVFAYNFPHRKTQDFLLRLFLLGYIPKVVFAADFVELNIPSPSIRTKLRYTENLHPKIVTERIGAQFINIDHNSLDLANIVKSMNLDLGIIAGARILKKHIIDSFNIGIINFHPGLIPHARGLDSMMWSIYNEIPLGVTAHLIDERIDAGRILFREEIDIFKDDTIYDLYERLYEKQLGLIDKSINNAIKGIYIDNIVNGKYNRKMPPDKEKKALEKLQDYLDKFSKT